MARHIVGTTAELPPGSRVIVTVDGRSIGVFNIDGRHYALRNVCPHRGGPLCLGAITGTTEPREVPGDYPELQWVRDGEILRCPWHKWEFDIATGRTVFPSRFRVATYPVSVELNEAERERLEVGVETYPVTVEGEVVILDA